MCDVERQPADAVGGSRKQPRTRWAQPKCATITRNWTDLTWPLGDLQSKYPSMSKTLIVVRHGHADPGEADFARQLSQRGVSEANATGRRLAERGLALDAILTSTAPRALETAIAVAEQCGFDGEVQRSDALYLAEPTTILRSVRGMADTVQTLLLVGHNPGLSAVVELITGQMCELHTAEAVRLELRVEHWRDVGL